MVSVSDQELVGRYVANGDQEAFAQLVQRHGSMVHRAAWRMAPQCDEDVAQAVFVILARRAACLRRLPTISGWLYQTTRCCASNARRQQQRRRRRDEEAAMREDTSGQQSTTEVRELLDTGLAAISASLREVLVLRYLEGMSVKEVAGATRISEAAVAKRTERGLEAMRRCFAGRGVMLEAGAIAATLAGEKSDLTQAVLDRLSHPSTEAATRMADVAIRQMRGATMRRVAFACSIVVAISGVAVAVGWAQQGTAGRATVATTQVIQEKRIMKEPRIIQRGPVVLVGVSKWWMVGRTPPGFDMGRTIGEAWDLFEAYRKASDLKPKQADAWYEVHFEEKAGESTVHWVVVGTEVAEGWVVPKEFETRTIPASSWAVFETPASDMGPRQWTRDRDQWMQTSGWKQGMDMELQFYGPRFKGMKSPESVMEFWVPVTKP